jgi:hypothetical protein
MISLGHLVARWTLAAGAVLAPVAIIASGGTAAQTVTAAGSQGTDTALPLTESAVTVQGRGRFADLTVTVNQTRNLSNQAVSITWTGATPTRRGPADFAAHYLQIFQCWGDDDGTVPGNPGPPPEQCVQGAVAGVPGSTVGNIVPPGSLTFERVIRHPSWAPLDPPTGVTDPNDGFVWRPFRAVDGRVVDIQVDSRFVPGQAGTYWLNGLFDVATTNEIGVAPTAPDGTGAALLEVNTGVQSPGLGCGQKREKLGDGSTRVPQCWIVIVPRGEPEDENVNTAPNNEGEFADQRGVLTSPLSPQAWPNRIAVPIEVNPVDNPCDINADARKISGSDLAVPAVVSWQPVLCSSGALPPYTYARTADSAARLQLSGGRVGMAVVSRPLNQPADPLKQIVYAPLTASGVVIGFNIERTPAADAPDEAQALSGIRVADLNLTPRLVAKLLTHSYGNAVNILFQPSGYGWLQTNPRHLYEDEDFIRFNPEFAQLQMVQGRTLGGLHLPAGNSDAARQMWQWILADPEAKAWLDGTPDEWGMQVNPAYAVVTGSVPDSFPKADPYCYQAPDVTIVAEPYTPPPLCTIDWMPLASNFGDAAANTRRAFDNSRIGEDLANPPQERASYWRRTTPQKIGQKGFLSVTDTASAAQYGIQTAQLSRAGDNGDNRVFIAADVAGLTAGVASMTPGTEPAVLEPALPAQPADAYPLTALAYAAVAPLTLDATARAEYAAFVEYAAGTGQESGTQPGELPRGYAPLPPALRQQALATAGLIRTMAPPVATTTTTVAPSTSTLAPSTTVAAQAADAEVGTSTPMFTSSGATTSSAGRSGSTTTASQTTATTSSTVASSIPADSAPPTTLPPASSEVPSSTAPEPVDKTVPTTTPPVLTPATDVSPTRYAMAGFAGTGLLAALAALEITKLPRRRAGASATAFHEEPVAS